MMHIQTRREVRERRMKYQVFAGMFDFLAIVAGVVVIIACAVLLKSLIDFTLREGQSSFRTLWQIFNDALIIPEGV